MNYRFNKEENKLIYRITHKAEEGPTELDLAFLWQEYLRQRDERIDLARNTGNYYRQQSLIQAAGGEGAYQRLGYFLH